MKRKKIALYLDMNQIEDLKALTTLTKVKMADYMREGIDRILSEHQGELKKPRKKLRRKTRKARS
jgi:hypothetical protein